MGCLFFQVHADSSLVIKSDIMGCLLRRSVYPSRQGEAQGRETALSGQGMFTGILFQRRGILWEMLPEDRLWL